MEHLLSARARTTTSSVIRTLLCLTEQPHVLSLAGGLPAPESFPLARLAAAAQRVMAEPKTWQYGPTEGLAELRDWAGDELGAPASRTIITTGSQQGLDLVARALLDPGDVVVVEAPAYVGALQALAANGADLRAIEADGDGLRTDRLARALMGGLRPKAVYVVTNFQNPSGATMSSVRRAALAELSDRFGFVVIEDDPYGALRFRGESLPSVAASGGVVVQLGTASKLLSPGLRVGWAALPAWLVDPVVRLKQSADLHTSTLAQRIAFDVLSDRAFMGGHIESLAALYQVRADALADALEGALQFERPDGGMFLWCRAPGLDTTALLDVAVAAGVAFVPGAAFHVDGTGTDRLRLSYATLTPEALGEAAQRLATVISSASRGTDRALLPTNGGR